MCCVGCCWFWFCVLFEFVVFEFLDFCFNGFGEVIGWKMFIILDVGRVGYFSVSDMEFVSVLFGVRLIVTLLFRCTDRFVNWEI